MSQGERLDDLTAREREVLDLVSLGLTNEEIAPRLGISEAGVKYHVSQILSKLGVASREEAAAAVSHHVAEAFQPRRRRWAVLVVAAKAAGAAMVLAAVAGLGVLAWGVLETSDDGTTSSLPVPTFTPSAEIEQRTREVVLNNSVFRSMTAGRVLGTDFWIGVDQGTYPVYGQRLTVATIAFAEPVEYSGPVPAASQPCKGHFGSDERVEPDEPCMAVVRDYYIEEREFVDLQLIAAFVEIERSRVIEVLPLHDAGTPPRIVQWTIDYYRQQWESAASPTP